MGSIERGYHPITDVAGNKYTFGKSHKTTVVFEALPPDHPHVEVNVRGVANRFRLGGIEQGKVQFVESPVSHRVFDTDPYKLKSGASYWSEGEVNAHGNTAKDMNVALTDNLAKIGVKKLLPDIDADTCANMFLFALPTSALALFGDTADLKGISIKGAFFFGGHIIAQVHTEGITHAFSRFFPKKIIGSYRPSLFAGYQIDRVIALQALRSKPLIREIKEK